MKNVISTLSPFICGAAILVSSTTVIAEETNSQILSNGSLVLHDTRTNLATAYQQGDKESLVWGNKSISPYQLGRVVKPTSNGHLMAITSVANKQEKKQGNKKRVVHLKRNSDNSVEAPPVRKRVKKKKNNKPQPTQLVELDREGNVVWRFQPEKNGIKKYTKLHHDFFITPENTVMLLTSGHRKNSQVTPATIIDDKLIEIDRQGNILWQWSALEHIEQLALSDTVKANIMNESPRKRAKLKREKSKNKKNIQTRNESVKFDELPRLADVFHANSIQVIPPNVREQHPAFAQGNILMSLRNLNRVIIIDKSSGDVVWVLKVPTLNQHSARMIPNGLAGAGNILLFDNGGLSHYTEEERKASRILEINPENHAIVWRYEEEKEKGKPHFFSKRMSGAQRLPNGNTLILNSMNGRIFEVTNSGEIAWQQENTKRAKGSHYRAYWAPERWLTDNYFNWW